MNGSECLTSLVQGTAKSAPPLTSPLDIEEKYDRIQKDYLNLQLGWLSASWIKGLRGVMLNKIHLISLLPKPWRYGPLFCAQISSRCHG